MLQNFHSGHAGFGGGQQSADNGWWNLGDTLGLRWSGTAPDGDDLSAWSWYGFTTRSHLHLWYQRALVKVHRLINASLSESYLPIIHTSSLSTCALSRHLHVSSLIVASYIKEIPQGWNLSLRTSLWYCFPHRCWLLWQKITRSCGVALLLFNGKIEHFLKSFEMWEMTSFTSY